MTETTISTQCKSDLGVVSTVGDWVDKKCVSIGGLWYFEEVEIRD